MKSFSYLAFAVGYRRVSLVLLQHGKLATWQTSCKAAEGVAETRAFAEEAMELLQPQVVVFEDIRSGTRKGKQSQRLMTAISEVAQNSAAHSVAIKRERLFRCRYAEAAHLAKCYPDLADKTPSRRFFDKEPHHVVLFEALALADQAVRGSSELLAANM